MSTTLPGTPPTGVVTCLFTDIEGSTRLEIELGTGPYREIRERHRALLREAFARYGGYEQGTEGDSFFVLFASPTDAVAAAVTAQRALAAEPWPAGVVVRVRMGLHTGEVESTGTDVIGLAINRTARIAAAAHGGQVILSEATRSVLDGRLPDGVTLRDLGEYRLKDLRTPDRLIQLVIDGLPADFPPPRSVDARPNNLPTQLTTFVGRERELADAGALLRRNRLLTLTGPGGTGKTRLSIQVAAAAVDAFPDGVWFVALEAVRDPALVASTIGRTLGVGDDPVRPPLDTLADAIGDRAMLLVLDNFEQVVGAGATVAELLRRCPHVTCLVTTRIALHVSGEQEYPVPGLPAPPDPGRLSEVDRLNLPRELRAYDPAALEQFEAVRLFIARASAVRPGFEVTNANAPAVAGIAARLHGMPLAIELAAARAKLLTPDQILARLDHHLAALTAGSRDLPERQQTLRGAIAWSYDLLDEPGRRLLARLAVFRGGFTLEAAEAVCGVPDDAAAGSGLDVVDGIGVLVDQSLVRLDESGDEARCAMLETIREFAAEMLAAGDDAEVVARRHAEVFLAFAETAKPQLSGSEQRLWLDRLEREHDNLRAALDWAAEHDPHVAVNLAFALWRFWQQRGYLIEARARLEAMAARGWALDPVDRGRFAEAFGGVAYWQSDQDATLRWYDEALAAWREVGDPREIANALYDRAYADMVGVMQGDTDADRRERSRRMLEEALAIYRELGDAAGEGNVVWGLGSVAYFGGGAQDAEPWFRRSLELHRAAGHRTMEAWSLHMLALTLLAQGRWREGRDTARHALRHFHEAGDIAGDLLTIDDLAIIALQEGEPEVAGRLYGAARHIQATTGTALADYVDQASRLFGIHGPRDVLAPDVLAQTGREGAAMGLDEVVAYALGVDDPAALGRHRDDPSDA